MPDLRRNEWQFSSEPVLVNSIEHVKGYTLLSSMEKMRLDAVVNRNIELIGENLSCTIQVEYAIIIKSASIKQIYYRVN